MQQNKIIKLANQNGWKLRKHTDPWVLIFDKGGTQINVWFTKMTVGVLSSNYSSSNQRYKSGKYYKHCSESELIKIFKQSQQTVQKKEVAVRKPKKFNLPPIDLKLTLERGYIQF